MNIEEAFDKYKKGDISFLRAVSVVIASDRNDEDKVFLIESLLEQEREQDLDDERKLRCYQALLRAPRLSSFLQSGDLELFRELRGQEGFWRGRQPDGPHTIL